MAKPTSTKTSKASPKKETLSADAPIPHEHPVSEIERSATAPDTVVQEQVITLTTPASSDDAVADTNMAPTVPSEMAGEETTVGDAGAVSTMPADADPTAVDAGVTFTSSPEAEAIPAPETATPGAGEAVDSAAQPTETLHSVMPAHPAADLFPLLPDDQLQELADDIRLRGLIEPVVTIEGSGTVMILDGRNRYRACVLAGVEPRTVAWDGSGGSPSGFVLAKNIHRRHLTPAQRAAIAVDLLPMLEVEARERQVAAAVTTNARLSAFEADGVAAPEAAGALIVRGRSRDLAASALGVSGRSVQEAKTISEQAPEVLVEVRGGALSLPEGRRIAALPSPDERKQAIKKAKSEKGIPKKRVPKVTAATPKAVDVLDAVRAAVGEVGRLLDAVPKESRPIWWTPLRNAVRKVAR